MNIDETEMPGELQIDCLKHVLGRVVMMFFPYLPDFSHLEFGRLHGLSAFTSHAASI